MPPTLILAGLIVLPIALTASLAYYTYRSVLARRAQRRTQHQQWHRSNAADTVLQPMKSTDPPSQTWPRALCADEGMPGSRFSPGSTFPVPYWGPKDEWGPKGNEALSRGADAPFGVERRRGGLAGGVTPLRRAATMERTGASGVPCETRGCDSVDPAREIWHRIELREGLGGRGGRGEEGRGGVGD